MWRPLEEAVDAVWAVHLGWRTPIVKGMTPNASGASPFLASCPFSHVT